MDEPVGNDRLTGPRQMTEGRRTAAFLTVLTALVLEVADSTIVNTALPVIRADLGASPSEMQWIVAGYLLALGSLLLLGGRLGDALGHSRVFLCGVGGFVTASVLCGLSMDPTQLVIARLVQGVAAAIMAPQIMAVVQLLYTPLERVQRLAYFGVILGLAAILGPIAGGILIQLDVLGLGWRSIFLVNVPIGLGAIVVGWRVLPEAAAHADLRLDPLGALIFACGFGGMLYALITGAEKGWSIAMLGLGVFAAAAVIHGWRRARKRRAAGLPSVIEPALFAIGTFRWATIAAFCFAAASIGFLLVFAVSLQQGSGLTALETAMIHIPFGLGVMLGIGLLVPRLLPRLGKVLPLAGSVLMIGGTVSAMLMIAGGNGGDVWLLAVLICAGIGMGTLSGPLGPIVVAEVPRQHAGTASATFRTAQQIGGATGIALIGAAYFAVDGGDAAARLAGLRPAAVLVAVILLLCVISVSRLPQRIFDKAD